MKLPSALTLSFGLMSVTPWTLADNVVNQHALHKKVTVHQALNMKDHRQVELKGYVVKSIGHEKYQFKDGTGTMIVDIDDELWQGKPVSAKTPVTITGEIDIDYKPFKRVEVEVDTVKFN